VAELETALQSIGAKLGSVSHPNESVTDAANTLTKLRADLAPPTPVSSPDTRLENAPVLSLFDNSILSRFRDDDTGGTTDGNTPPTSDNDGTHSLKTDNIRRTLLSAFPSQSTLDAILNVSQTWWHASRAMFPEIYGPESGTTVNQLVAESMASGSVQKLAKALLCISISLQEAPPGSNLNLGPSVSAADLTAHWLNLIHELVISDDDIAGTIDGIECLFLHSKHDINDGRIRRAWMSLRRGLAFSQLLGLHVWAPSTRPPHKQVCLRGQSLYRALYQGDRFLSLLLGLPYAVSEIHCTMPEFNGAIPNAHEDAPLKDEHYLLKLASVIGHVIDRNQEPPSSNTLPSTVKIEGEITDLAASMSSEWWANEAQTDDIVDQMYSRLLPQFWHHQARVLLHLPFMLKAATDRRYEYNKIAALESAREMIQRYRTFRPARGFGSLVCKVVDFQVFTAAMVLVLNLLSISQSSLARDQQEATVDEELVTITHDLLHRASLETEGGVTTQAAKALKMFCKSRAEPCDPEQKVARLVIPYFGTVVFGPGKNLTNQSYLKPSEAVRQPIQLPTPEMETLDNSLQDANFDNLLASIPSDLNFGAGIDGGMFTNVNLDLDQDWSWFWNNTSVP